MLAFLNPQMGQFGIGLTQGNDRGKMSKREAFDTQLTTELQSTRTLSGVSSIEKSRNVGDFNFLLSSTCFFHPVSPCAAPHQTSEWSTHFMAGLSTSKLN